MASTTTIYEPRGRAREYAKLAVNVFSGCAHACKYCYAPLALKRNRDEFHSEPEPRKDILHWIEADCKKIKIKGNGSAQVLLCFTCDPYQPIEKDLQVTRRAIQILHEYGLSVQILTKAGMRASRDFDLLTEKDAFATTMTFLDDERSLEWEPNAALPSDRIEAIKIANKKGIPTWVSLEPVIDPEQALQIIQRTHKFVDLFKVGPLNYRPETKGINWKKFGLEVIQLLEKLGKKYYIKDDLKKYL